MHPRRLLNVVLKAVLPQSVLLLLVVVVVVVDDVVVVVVFVDGDAVADVVVGAAVVLVFIEIAESNFVHATIKSNRAFLAILTLVSRSIDLFTIS
ncbi:hypothetical protein KIN20_021946 [Parelaphostrongylus tenuis]|uniref:Uncharacterized protein n=1 Tax=Parelaphostrongylus tenuis TaxID=148309 RepID=A0AAD5QV15_PARTN|nr:hypothetical protein KIN20_021946 [Parelaphostrongylus tenuis]